MVWSPRTWLGQRDGGDRAERGLRRPGLLVHPHPGRGRGAAPWPRPPAARTPVRPTPACGARPPPALSRRPGHRARLRPRRCVRAQRVPLADDDAGDRISGELEVGSLPLVKAEPPLAFVRPVSTSWFVANPSGSERGRHVIHRVHLRGQSQQSAPQSRDVRNPGPSGARRSARTTDRCVTSARFTRSGPSLRAAPSARCCRWSPGRRAGRARRSRGPVRSLRLA